MSSHRSSIRLRDVQPVTASEETRPNSFHALRRGSVPRRALIAEADPATQNLCRDVLQSVGFRVDLVDTGVGAVVAARESALDLIMMDIQLRDVPAREAIGWLRSNPALRATPIVILTENGEDDPALLAAGPAAALRKPLSPLVIRRTLQTLLM